MVSPSRLTGGWNGTYLVRIHGRREWRPRINKTLRFCRRCIDVVFILSSLMSTCELDRFVIQTPYIKVLKSCSAPFVDSARIDDNSTTHRRTDGRTDGQTDETNKREHGWMNADSPLQVRAPLVSQNAEERSYPCASADSPPLTWKTVSCAQSGIFFRVTLPRRKRDEIYHGGKRNELL